MNPILRCLGSLLLLLLLVIITFWSKSIFDTPPKVSAFRWILALSLAWLLFIKVWDNFPHDRPRV